jgi:hypothetical protein
MTSKASKAKVTETKAKTGALKDLKPGRVKEDSNVKGGADRIEMTYKSTQVTYKPQDNHDNPKPK